MKKPVLGPWKFGEGIARRHSGVVVPHEQVPWNFEFGEYFLQFGVRLGFTPMGEVARDHAEFGVTKVPIDAVDSAPQMVVYISAEQSVRAGDDVGVGKVNKFEKRIGHCSVSTDENR